MEHGESCASDEALGEGRPPGTIQSWTPHDRCEEAEPHDLAPPQDTRTAQVPGTTSCRAQGEPISEARRIGIWERVAKRMVDEGTAAPTGYWGRSALSRRPRNGFFLTREQNLPPPAALAVVKRAVSLSPFPAILFST